MLVPALPRRLPFVKMNGLGNDFVVADLRACPEWSGVLSDPALVRRVCDRHRGVGADGILAIAEGISEHASASMRVHNSDGSIAEMCGNGLRCVARYVFEQMRAEPQIPSRQAALTIDTGAGALRCELSLGADRTVESIAVDMGRPVLIAPELVELVVGPSLTPLHVMLISMGNPHAVQFCDETLDYDRLVALATRLGPHVETDQRFAHRTNAEFVVNRPQPFPRLDVVVWERGCGITQACGTGACAAVVAACRRGLIPLGAACTVRLPGGTLVVTVASDFSSVRMRGPAETVFCGEIATSSIMAVDGATQ